MHLTRPVLALFATCFLGAQEALPLKLPPPATGGAPLAETLAGRKTIRTLAGPAELRVSAPLYFPGAFWRHLPPGTTAPPATMSPARPPEGARTAVRSTKVPQ